MTAWRWDPDMQERVPVDMATYMRGPRGQRGHATLIDEVDAWAETFRRRALERGPLVVVPPAGRLGDAMRQLAREHGYRVVEVADAVRLATRPTLREVYGPRVAGRTPALCVRCAITQLTS